MWKINIIGPVIICAMVTNALLTSCNRSPNGIGRKDLSSELPGEAILDPLIPIDLADVQTGGVIGQRISSTIKNNLLTLNLDRDFLDPFRKKDQSSGYIGLGKLIDASVRFAAHTRDAQVVQLKDYLIDETISTQESDGYIGMFIAEERMWSLWDIHEMGYLIWGLTANEQFFNSEPSLKAAVAAADYIIDHWSTMPEGWGNQHVAPHVAVTGLERAMLALYKRTGEQRFMDFCIKERELGDWDLDIVVGRRAGIEGHIYAYMARCLAQLELNRLAPDEELIRQTQRALNFLTAQDGMTITGGAGQWEIWTDDQDGGHALGETCATAYQMRVYENLLRQTADAFYGDLMERTIYNTLFAAQSPDGRQIRYYTPLEGQREYFQGDSYCCPNNYRRIVAELPSMIYYRTLEGGVAINLFTASETVVDLGEEGTVKITQETDYPHSGLVKIGVNPSIPVRFTIQIRIPAWAQGSKMLINDKSWKENLKPGSMTKIDRKWLADDKITLDMPMEWRFVKGRKRQAGSVAIMRGPVLFCLDPSKNQDRGLEGFNDLELWRLIIDPTSVEGPIDDAAAKYGGMACRIGAWREGHGMGGKHDMTLLFTEFTDPEGKATYFKIRDMSIAVDDELIRKEL